MMSYLWILLLGSLLAAHAEAQDDETPALEASPGTPAPTSDVKAVTIEEHGAEDTAEEESVLPEPTAGSEVEADQPAAPADESTEAEATDAPEEVEGQPMTPTAGEPEASTPVADVEADAPATTQAAGSEDDAPVQTAVGAEEEPTVSAATTPAHEASGLGTTPTVGVKAADTEEAPTDAAANEESSTDEITTVLEDLVRTNPGFNLKNAMEPSQADPNADGFDLEDAKDGSEDLSPSTSRSRALNLGNALNGGNENPSASEGPSLGASESGHQPQKGSSSSLAGILSAIVVAAVGAVAGYFTYQQKKLCFKNRQEADPEAPHKADAAEAQSDPQVLSTLLNSS